MTLHSCTHCGKLAPHEVRKKLEGIIVIERYCSDCIEPTKFAMLQRAYEANAG